MRNVFADQLYQNAQDDDRISIVVADISPAGPMADFRTHYPDRFINVGVAEQAMTGIAAGMALRGLRPFTYTIATFSLYRPFEMIRDDLAYQGLPVTVVGIGGGVIYSTLGGTHHAQEDVALACTVPNMKVITPSDPLEVRHATDFCARVNEGGPCYLRLGKAGEPELTAQAEEPYEQGRLRYVTRGHDVCVLSYGVIAGMAGELANALRTEGKSVSFALMNSIKPLDEERLAEMLESHDQVVVVEECAPVGSLSMQLQALAWREKADCDLHCFTLQDAFIHNYGTHKDLLADHGLGVGPILRQLGYEG